MIEDFFSFLLGRYTNRDQAFYNPSKFAYIHCYWERIGAEEMQSKHWYNYAGEDAPYRQKKHRVETEGNNIIVRNFDDNWDKYPCDMIFTRTANTWEGTNHGDCQLLGATMETKMTLTGTEVLCYDAGVKDGKIVWGGKDLYTFKRVTDGL